MGITSLNLVANLSHSLIERGFVQHPLETGGDAEIYSHEKLKWRLLNLLVVDLHLAHESFPLLGQSDEPKL